MLRRTLAFLVPALSLAAWQALSSSSPDESVSPSDVLHVLLRDLASYRLANDAAITLFRLFAGLILGASVGVAVAYVFFFGRTLRTLIEPTLGFLGQFPPIVWTPLVIMVAGIGDLAKIELVALCTFFIWFPAQLRALDEIDPALREALQIFEPGRSFAVSRFYFPSTLPALFSALRLSIVLGWVILIAAELIGSSNGLGWYVWDARNFGRDAQFFVGLIAIGIVGMMLTTAVDFAARAIMPWRRELKTGSRYASHTR